MVYIKEYWKDKGNRAEKAKAHTKHMETKYNELIKKAVNNTTTYETDFTYDSQKDCKTKIIVENSDTVSAGCNHNVGKTALLNFSSYVHPGGMFINGSQAQEESLCHESFLYNVLFEFEDSFYAWNNKHKNKALYMNRGLYTPNVVFEHNNNTFLCDVITCAAPNKSAAQRYQNVSDAENLKSLKSRIKYVLDIAAKNDVNTLILGAYGCGVFGQNPYEVASIFKEYLNTTHKCFDTVIFAIPKGINGNLDAFNFIFREK